ncbi:hypothetical protein [Kordiimonas sp. SCSIO 12610]|uniref:hypothetical protein n=1 Tax=Kordiimonas sp. SCSIO 12610 TaxID=2829597 RepID=UPI00210F1D6D|nr:hypothetical protein [Kordiimonas sp. SCSIO 12610]UTW53959.1 hypothetical protein KFF44_08905 [Kordiimonas sp. SCSIO 12610]
MNSSTGVEINEFAETFAPLKAVIAERTPVIEAPANDNTAGDGNTDNFAQGSPEISNRQSGELSGDKFAKFYGEDIWMMGAHMISQIGQLPISDCAPLLTAPDQRDVMIDAMRSLEDLSHEYEWLAWLRSPQAALASNLGSLALFSIMKMQGTMAIMQTIKQKKQYVDDKNAPPVAQPVKDAEEGEGIE